MAKVTRAAKRDGVRIGGVAAACIGLALAGLGTFLLLSFLTGDVDLDPAESAKSCWTGLLGAWVAFGGIHTVGTVPAVGLAVLMICWGLYVAKGMRFVATWPNMVGGILMIVAVSLGACAFADSYDMRSGGLLAVYASPPAILYFGRWGLVLAAMCLMIVGVLLAFGEAAVYGAHNCLFRLRDLVLGFFGVLGRVRELLFLLLRPRFAVAGGVAGERFSSRAGTEDFANPPAGGGTRFAAPPSAKPAADVPDGESVSDHAEREDSAFRAASPAAAEKDTEPVKPAKTWAPRGKFVSRYLNLDLVDDDAPDVSEPVRAAIAPQPDSWTAGALPDVIMDVDAESEDTDGIIVEGVCPDASSAYDTPAVRACDVDAADDGDVVEVPVVEAPPVMKTPVSSPTAAAPSPRPAPAPSWRPAVARKPEATGDLSSYELPPLTLLDPPEPPVVEDRGQIEARARILEQTLGEFKIDGRVVHIERGPRVTMYELSLAPGIRLNKVTSLADNIAMQLKAESVRIIAPIPGKNTIGIEIPNTCKELVSLREIVDSVNREKRRQALPVCLGKDVSGQALVADLARMPHLLIAGATGSGKSVCINSIILSLMMCCKPDEAQMIMVDPKVVELSRFKDIPHLMSPVITDMKRAVAVLEWICQKMDERYEQMSQVSVNNIAKFNALGEDGVRSRLDAFASLEEIEAFPKRMPYMVVIIDELADLMMVAGKEVEQHITRLAAKSRAVGIHLILATQRPSVDVITGLIKANMPCRIAFQVASRVDSRTILDQNGADSLLGQGDMLYLPPGVGKLIRAQGVFVSDEELFRVVDFTKAEADPQYHSDLLGPVIGGGGGDVDVSSFDELFMQSGAAIIENQRGSVSLLQRKFGIGYGRASRIIDQLASVGLLGPFRDGKAREILLTMEEFQSRFGGAADSPWDDDGEDDGRPAGLRDDERERECSPWDEEDS